MVCDKCEKKLGARVCVPDPWKKGARNTRESGGQKVNENKLLSARRKERFSPYQTKSFGKCKVCKQDLHQPGKFCLACAYKKGVCSMCGVVILDTTYYKQSSV